MKALAVVVLAFAIGCSAQVFPNLERNAWNTCVMPDCQPGGTTAPTKVINQVVQSGPFAGTHQIGLAGPAYTNLLTFDYVGATEATHFILSLDAYISPWTLQNAQAFEFDVFSYVPPYKYQDGSECVVSAKWQVWNQRWTDTERNCDLKAGWNHIEWWFHIGNGLIWYDTLGVNYVYSDFNLVYPADVLPPGWGSNSGVDVQLDESATGKTVTEYVKHVTLTEF
jgi:hypothetical protein